MTEATNQLARTLPFQFSNTFQTLEGHRKTESLIMDIATQKDLANIVAIYNQSIVNKTATADLQPVNLAQKQIWFDEHRQNRKRPIYVIKNESGEVMAWGSFSDFKGLPAYHISVEISIYVSKKYQKQKLGKTLLQCMLQQAPKLAIKNVVALIFAHNKASLSLFKKAGFAIWGTLPKICDMEGFIADVMILGKAIP